MSRTKDVAVLAVGAVFGATLVGGTAYAATGGTFVLGRANAASTQTGLNNSGAGPVLSLSTRGGQAPLAVSAGAGKAPNLDADRLDGSDSSAFALASGRTGSVSAESVAVDIDENGTPDALAAYAECPAGAKLVGGGFEDYTPGSGLISAPADNGWLYVSELTDDVSDVVAHATCYNPRGSVAGSTAQNRRAGGALPLTAEQRAKVLQGAQR